MTVFFDLIAQALAFIYAAVPNYAVAIIGLTTVIMLIVTPLTLKGTRSMMVMQQLQPEMKKIQSRYKDDRQKLNEELLKFYKDNDISPMGGCLPLLVQMPVFIVLYQVLRGLTRRLSDAGTSIGWVSGQLGNGVTPSKPHAFPLNTFDPAYLNHNSKMYIDLHGSTTMQAFGLDLSESAAKALSHGLAHALPYLLLIVIVGVTGVVQQRQIQGRTPSQQVNPQQQVIMKIMPIFLPVVSFGLPAGLVLYFVVSNLYRVGQQWFISRSIYGIKGGVNPHATSEAADTPKVGLFAALKQSTSDANTAAQKRQEAKASAGGTKGRSGATKASATKSTPAKAGASKAPSRALSGRTTPAKGEPAKAASSDRSSDAPPKRGAGKPSTTRTPASRAAPKDRTTTGPGTAPLQPRARKNKKR